ARARNLVLAWHAGDVGTGTTNPPSFHDGGLVPGLREVPGQKFSAGSAAKDDDFEPFGFRHECLHLRSSSRVTQAFTRLSAPIRIALTRGAVVRGGQGPAAKKSPLPAAGPPCLESGQHLHDRIRASAGEGTETAAAIRLLFDDVVGNDGCQISLIISD